MNLHRMMACIATATCTISATVSAQQPAFQLAPAVAVEAEEFQIHRGWRVLAMGEGNYAVDIIGFSHTGGERFLSTGNADTTAAATRDISVPQPGAYRLWVRYEYMPFTETRFRVAIEQGGKNIAEKIIGAQGNPRYAFGEAVARPQYDPPWGNEGLVEELVEVPNLVAGPARLILEAAEQPQFAGRSANRNVDLLYLTADLKDAWREHYKGAVYYPILDAFRDSRGARYEVQFTNRGAKPLSISTHHIYNRNQFYGRLDPPAAANELAPAASSAWLPMPAQDTTHFGVAMFSPSAPQAFTVAVRPSGGTVEETVQSSGEPVRIFLPTYPGRGEKPIDLMKQLAAVIEHLKNTPKPGKLPTRPLCYGWTVPLAEDSEYGRQYAQLWAAMGMRSYLSGVMPTAVGIKNLQAAGVPLTRSVGYIEYRFPPTTANIAKAKTEAANAGALDKLRWLDYGDEIAFSEWVGYLVEDKRAETSNKDLKPEDVLRPLWRDWLAKNRPGFKPADYWRAAWGAVDAGQLRPDSSAEASREAPRLYVDSVIFYEDAAIGYIARGTAAAKAALGPDVLCGANYSGYPFYYPLTTPYVKWFRDGAGDFGRHSEYFWQLGQVTPAIDGYFSEHFRAGMRFNPKAIIKQYTMSHSPGNTDASFRRACFTHLAHGVKNLDFFGIAFGETFAENYIDHRDRERFRAIRDVTHSMALVEDVLEQSQVVPSDVGLLISESTERRDFSGIATDMAGHNYDNKDSFFRKSRLSFHQDRVGIWTALTFAGSSPDLLIERDVKPEILNGYKVLFVVGDSVPASVVPALESWIKQGGVLFATADVGRYGSYREQNPALQNLLGVESQDIEERDTFIRTSQELPFLKPLGAVGFCRSVGQSEVKVDFPALAIRARIQPSAGITVFGRFKDDNTPAVILRALGNGKVYYTATLPGLAYLYTGLRTPRVWVADRGPGAHRAVTTYDRVAAHLLTMPLRSAGVAPQVSTNPKYIDTRLIRSGNVFFLPLANYNQKVGQQVLLKVRVPQGAKRPTAASSAFAGKLEVQIEAGHWIITLPRLGYGDLVRIETQ